MLTQATSAKHTLQPTQLRCCFFDSLSVALADQPYTEQGYPTSLPLSPGAAHRQQQLEHLRQARKQKQAEREARCLSGKPPKGPSAAGHGLAARRNHNAGVRATTQVRACRRICTSSRRVWLAQFARHHVAEQQRICLAPLPAMFAFDVAAATTSSNSYCDSICNIDVHCAAKGLRQRSKWAEFTCACCCACIYVCKWWAASGWPALCTCTVEAGQQHTCPCKPAS
jgi:hypothetical protein